MSTRQGAVDPENPNDAAWAECAAIVSTDSVSAALAFLNGRTRFRFTGIYQVDPPHLRNVLLFDRENPAMNLSGEVTRLEDTYCALTYASGPFETADAPRDGRLVNHASRNSIISYTGVPVHLPTGHLWGTLCHFDVRPRLLPQDERSFLQAVGPLLVAALHRDAPPGAVSVPTSTVPRDSGAPRT